MELISAVLSTALGKAAAGLAVATASVGGLHAAEVVDVPVLPDVADQEQEVEVDEAPADGLVVADAAKQKAEDRRHDDEEVVPEIGEVEEEGGDDAPTADDGARQATGASGLDVSQRAQAGEIDGRELSSEVVANTPAAGKAATPTPGHPEDLPEAAQQGQERRAAAPVPDHADDGSEARVGEGDEEAGEPQGGPETGAEKRAAAGADRS